MKKLKIGLIGFGTVGVGVYKTLQNFEEIEVVKIAVKNINKPRSIELPNGILTDNPYEIINDENINVVVELMGGVEPAWDYIKTALENKNLQQFYLLKIPNIFKAYIVNKIFGNFLCLLRTQNRVTSFNI